MKNEVYLVMAISHITGGERHGIFSTREKASEWADTQDENTTCIISNFVIDCPEYGNEVQGKNLN